MTNFAAWCAAEEQVAAMLAARAPELDRGKLFATLETYALDVVQFARAHPAPAVETAALDRALEWLGRPVFLCGHHRSGTTLLQELLDGHPQLLVLPVEVTYFTSSGSVAVANPSAQALDAFVVKWVVRLIDPNGKRHFHLGRAAAEHNPSLEFARALFAWHAVFATHPAIDRGCAALCALAAAYRATAMPTLTPLRWVEKTPLNERHVARLVRLGDARFVQMVRDPRATLRSQLADLNAAAVPNVDPAEQAWRIGRSLRWARKNLARHPARYQVTRYEDLTEQPVAQMERVREFLGISPHPALAIPTVLGHAVSSNSAFKSGRPGVIHESRLNGILGVHEARLLAAFTGGIAARFGYAADDRGDPPLRAAHTLRLLCRAAWRRVCTVRG